MKQRHSIPQVLLDELVEGHVIPLIGSGFSKNAEGLSPGETMPQWDELGKQVANKLEDFEYDGNPTAAMSEFVERYNKGMLIDYLRKFLYEGRARPGKAHLLLTEMPFDTVLTTNFDTLLEDAYRAGDLPYKVVSDVADLAVNRSPTRIVKIHGDLTNYKNLIITKEDYDSVLENKLLHSSLLHWFATKTILCIGYSARDPDFLQLIAELKDILGSLRRQPFILLVNPSEEDMGKCRRRGIYPIALRGTGESPKEIITSALSQMFQYYKSIKQALHIDFANRFSELRSLDVNNISVPTKIKNKELYRSILQFNKEAALYLSNVICTVQQSKRSHDTTNPHNTVLALEQKFLLYDSINFIVDGNRSILESLPAYSNCKKIMNRDTEMSIANQVDRYHRTFGLLQQMSHWTYISHILKSWIYLYINTNNFDIESFSKAYVDLEHFFSNDSQCFVALSPIYNFMLGEPEQVKLTNELVIRRITDREQLVLRNTVNWLETGIFRFEEAKYVIEYSFKMKKGFGSEEDYGTFPSNIYSIFASIIAALRLFRIGKVGINSMHKMVQLDVPLIPDSIDLYADDLGITLGDYYILDSNNIGLFQKFWERYGSLLINKVLDYKRYEHDKYSQVKVAVRNFLQSYIKKDDDQFVDFMKSLMALLFLDNEIQSRTADDLFVRRCTNLLEPDEYDVEVVRNEVRRLSEVFNRIIRGRDLEGRYILKLREYTARCIIKYLDAMKSDSFSHESFIRSIDHN